MPESLDSTADWHDGRVATARAFLSHSSADKPFVRRLAVQLDAAGVGTWIDEVEIGVGDSLLEKIGEGIESASHLVVVISRHSAASRWVSEELRSAMAEQISTGIVKVLPVKTDSTAMPYFLRDRLYADFSDPVMFSQGVASLLRAMGVRPTTSPPGDVRWYCTHCGWACPASIDYNDYACLACGGIALESPVGSMTMAKCGCGAWNPLVARFCRTCGADSWRRPRG